ncbi:MAG: type II secretion system GspH family protein [Acetobacter sp.]|nr:type II secretion system GspH family protein [Acetobacter sp.]
MMKILKENQHGRSMIEMLGVLAIVGILSVGGISGYSKAMLKIKLNKMIDEYIQFIQSLALFKNDFMREKDLQNIERLYFASYYPPTELPYGWTAKASTIIDNFGVHITPYVQDRLVVSYYLKRNEDINENKEMCRVMLLNIVKPFHETLEAVWIYRGNATTGGNFYGTGHCNGSNKKCISDITPNEAINLCNTCLEDTICILEFSL